MRNRIIQIGYGFSTFFYVCVGDEHSSISDSSSVARSLMLIENSLVNVNFVPTVLGMCAISDYTPSLDNSCSNATSPPILGALTVQVMWAQCDMFKPNPHFSLPIAPCGISDLTSAKKALMILEWKVAMTQEFQALQWNGTWELILRMLGDNVINLVWVFNVKQKEDGTIEQLKVQIVANGLRN